MREVEGRQICKVLKRIRRGLIRENGLQITQPVCRNKDNYPGTCPVCERELAEINILLGKDGKYSDTENRMGNIRAKYRYDRRCSHHHPSEERTGREDSCHKAD